MRFKLVYVGWCYSCVGLIGVYVGLPLNFSRTIAVDGVEFARSLRFKFTD